MAALPESTSFVLVRGETWQGVSTSEPYEAGWAREAVVFLRPLDVEGGIAAGRVHVQISPDGMRWADEGTVIAIPGEVDAVAFAKIAHFGNWLRLRAELPPGARCTMLATLHLKA